MAKNTPMVNPPKTSVPIKINIILNVSITRLLIIIITSMMKIRDTTQTSEISYY